VQFGGPARVRITHLTGIPGAPSDLDLAFGDVKQMQSIKKDDTVVTPFGIMAHDQADNPAYEWNIVITITEKRNPNGPSSFTFGGGNGKLTYRGATGLQRFYFSCESIRDERRA
jgi:hypothetical protein